MARGPSCSERYMGSGAVTMMKCHFSHNDRGETLTETLAAVLVATVSIVMLTTAVVTSARLNDRARQQTIELWGDPSAPDSSRSVDGELSAAEKGEGVYIDKSEGTAASSSKDGEVIITNPDTGSSQTYRDVSLSGGEDIVSWQLGGDD